MTDELLPCLLQGILKTLCVICFLGGFLSLITFLFFGNDILLIIGISGLPLAVLFATIAENL